MSPPVFLAPVPPDVDELELTGEEGHHAAAVRRVRVGELVDLVDGRGTRAHCQVLTVTRERVTLAVRRRIEEPAPRPRLVLVQALAKGDRGERAVELATEVGVDEVVPWAAARCVTAWAGARGERARQRWVAIARAAAKQSGRAWVPEVAAAVGTPALMQRLEGCQVLVLDPAAPLRLPDVAITSGCDLAVVVGPEGGIDPAELTGLVEAGAQAVRLGPTVLRTSTAGAVAVALLGPLTGRW